MHKEIISPDSAKNLTNEDLLRIEWLEQNTELADRGEDLPDFANFQNSLAGGVREKLAQAVLYSMLSITKSFVDENKVRHETVVELLRDDENENEVVGFSRMSMKHFEAERRAGEPDFSQALDFSRSTLNILSVAPDSQGKGFGGELLTSAENRSRAAGKTALNLIATQSAKNFYESHGYEQHAFSISHSKKLD